jgi:hypothetical protein
MTEQALYATRIEQTDKLPGRYSRVYFGSEFCERLMPSDDDVRRVVETAGGKGIAVTVLTPYVTGAGIVRLKELFDALAPLSAGGLEVVVNDWGTLRILDTERFIPVLGRLLTRQEHDPRIPHIKKRTPAMDDHFRSFPMDSDISAGFLARWNIHRMELDNVFQGIRRTGTMTASLYVPYGYLSTTRMCPFRDRPRPANFIRRIDECGKECEKYTVTLTNKDMKETILMRGNTQFFRNEAMPENLASLSIDRIVYQPELPA